MELLIVDVPMYVALYVVLTEWQDCLDVGLRHG